MPCTPSMQNSQSYQSCESHQTQALHVFPHAWICRHDCSWKSALVEYSRDWNQSDTTLKACLGFKSTLNGIDGVILYRHTHTIEWVQQGSKYIPDIPDMCSCMCMLYQSAWLARLVRNICMHSSSGDPRVHVPHQQLRSKREPKCTNLWSHETSLIWQHETTPIFSWAQQLGFQRKADFCTWWAWQVNMCVVLVCNNCVKWQKGSLIKKWWTYITRFRQLWLADQECLPLPDNSICTSSSIYVNTWEGNVEQTSGLRALLWYLRIISYDKRTWAHSKWWGESLPPYLRSHGLSRTVFPCWFENVSALRTVQCNHCYRHYYYCFCDTPEGFEMSSKGWNWGLSDPDPHTAVIWLDLAPPEMESQCWPFILSFKDSRL